MFPWYKYRIVNLRPDVSYMLSGANLRAATVSMTRRRLVIACQKLQSYCSCYFNIVLFRATLKI